MDILIRTSRVVSICKALGPTSEWLEIDESSIPGLVKLVEYVELAPFGDLKSVIISGILASVARV